MPKGLHPACPGMKDVIECLKYILANRPDSTLIISFSDLKDKVGINPQTSYETPVGIYGYVLNRDTITDFRNLINFETEFLVANELSEFALDRRYIHVIEIGPSFNIIDSETYRFNDFTDVSTEVAMEAYHSSKSDHPLTVFWNLTRITSKSPAAWTKTLLKARVDVVIDYGTGTIHENEPHQAVILNPKAVNVIATFPNPFKKSDVKIINKDNRSIQMFLEDNIRIDYIYGLPPVEVDDENQIVFVGEYIQVPFYFNAEDIIGRQFSDEFLILYQDLQDLGFDIEFDEEKGIMIVGIGLGSIVIEDDYHDIIDFRNNLRKYTEMAHG